MNKVFFFEVIFGIDMFLMFVLFLVFDISLVVDFLLVDLKEGGFLLKVLLLDLVVYSVMKLSIWSYLVLVVLGGFVLLF